MTSVQVKGRAPAKLDFSFDESRSNPLKAREDSTAASRDSSPLRIALAGGGTGGHIVPGLHLLSSARARAVVEDVLWFQTGRAVEARVLAGAEAKLLPARLERVTLALEPEGGGAPNLSRLAIHTLPAVLRDPRGH